MLELLTQRGADTSTLKDLAGRTGGWAMIVFARIDPDTDERAAAEQITTSWDAAMDAALEKLGVAVA